MRPEHGGHRWMAARLIAFGDGRASTRGAARAGGSARRRSRLHFPVTRTERTPDPAGREPARPMRLVLHRRGEKSCPCRLKRQRRRFRRPDADSRPAARRPSGPRSSSMKKPLGTVPARHSAPGPRRLPVIVTGDPWSVMPASPFSRLPWRPRLQGRPVCRAGPAGGIWRAAGPGKAGTGPESAACRDLTAAGRPGELTGD